MYNVQVIVNGEWIFAQDLKIEQIKTIQKLLEQIKQ